MELQPQQCRRKRPKGEAIGRCWGLRLFVRGWGDQKRKTECLFFFFGCFMSFLLWFKKGNWKEKGFTLTHSSSGSLKQWATSYSKVRNQKGWAHGDSPFLFSTYSLGLSFVCLGMVLATVRMKFPTSINSLVKLIVNTAIMPCDITGGIGRHWIREKPGASASCILSRGHDKDPGDREASPILSTPLQSWQFVGFFRRINIFI